MVTSDIDHSNSADHHDVKDLSFRSQPHQAPVITSTAPIIHLESSSTDIENGRSSSQHAEQTHMHESVLRTARMRKISETSGEIEHNNNNYKFKNYIQQRFSQDTHHMDEVHMNGYNGEHLRHQQIDEKIYLDTKKRKIQSDTIDCNSCDEKPHTNGIKTEIKSELSTNAQMSQRSKHLNGGHSFPVPIFALHSQGTYYVPMNIEYEALLPFLNGSDLVDKNFYSITQLHPININVCYSPATVKNLSRPRVENFSNGW